MNLDLTWELPHWLYWGALLLFPLVYMALAGWREERRAADADDTAARTYDVVESTATQAAGLRSPGNAFTRFADRISQFSGAFVAYWTVIAVVVYFYEVVARYFLRAPTNWAHESMFLMFGMQYVLAGAHAYLHDAHVRVDLFYAKAGPLGQAAIDIVTHFFFLIFALAFIWTAWTFFAQSMNHNTWFWAQGYSDERSFTEWGVAYYPVKFTLFLGSVLMLIQGLSRLVKDIQVFRATGEAEAGR